MQKTSLGEFFLREYMGGPVFAVARIQANSFEGSFPYISQILEETHFGRIIHVAPVFAPARILEKIPGEFFMYWFRARRYCLEIDCD